jgi:hypothetical protein
VQAIQAIKQLKAFKMFHQLAVAPQGIIMLSRKCNLRIWEIAQETAQWVVKTAIPSRIPL